MSEKKKFDQLPWADIPGPAYFVGKKTKLSEGNVHIGDGIAFRRSKHLIFSKVLTDSIIGIDSKGIIYCQNHTIDLGVVIKVLPKKRSPHR